MKTDFTIKFDGQLNQVDANTLINSLINISAILQEINNELDPDKKLDVRVKAFSAGSFNIDLQIAQGLIDTIFSRETVTYTGAVLGIFVGLIKIKEFLEGKKSDSTKEAGNGNVVIINGGQSITVNQKALQIYEKNRTVNDALNKNFETLEEDSSIEAFEIIDDKNESLLEIQRSKFSTMASTNALLEKDEKSKSITDDNANLIIFKLVFHERHKWEFYYKGNKITAKIIDDTFFKSIDEGRKFSKGDTLMAVLQINQVYDGTISGYVNKSYEVLKVNNHIPKSEPLKLDM